MSHEIRTPLTGIMGFAGLLRGAGRPAAPTPAPTSPASPPPAAALLTVVNDILDFSKIEAGQVELDAQPFDPGRVRGRDRRAGLRRRRRRRG